jgi:hypothetical protein
MKSRDEIARMRPHFLIFRSAEPKVIAQRERNEELMIDWPSASA